MTVWIEWVEQFGPNDEPVYMKASREAVIAHQKVVGKRMGKPYPDDESALDDFIVVHWASIREVLGALLVTIAIGALASALFPAVAAQLTAWKAGIVLTGVLTFKWGWRLMNE